MLAGSLAVVVQCYSLPETPVLCRFAANAPELPEGADLFLLVIL